MDVYEWGMSHGCEFDQILGDPEVKATEVVHAAYEGYCHDHDDGPCEQQL